MKPASFLRKLFLALMAMVLLSAALPSSVFAQSNLMRFIIENKSNQAVTVRLYSSDGAGRAYYMSVSSQQTKFMTPERGQYSYHLTACGITTRGQLDLSKHQFKWMVPKCGDKGGPGSKAPNTQDVGRILALTKVTLVNKTGARLVLTLRGPQTYVFTIPAGSEKVVSITRGEYTWGHFACNNGEYQRGNLTASANRVREISCK
ncbi:MAG: hypothetical protein KIT46_07815 [Anaerolineales bacterium]|nr:hypothetical protein [Anaerolineales bacterium]MCW5855936.1 hypothetical protein [Anaerolineales bacterium]